MTLEMDGTVDIPSQDIYRDEPLKKKLLRNGFWLYFFSFIAAPAGYLIKILIARQLSVEDIGIFYAILGFIGIISTYHDLGLTEALQYYLPHYLIDKEYGKAKTIIVFTRLMQFATAFVICGLLWRGADWLAVHYFKTAFAGTLLKYFCVYLLVINLFSVLQSVFLATQKVKLSGLIDTLRIWIVVILTGLSIYFGSLHLTTFTTWWIIGLVASTACGLGFLGYHFGWLFRYPLQRSRKTILTQWTYGFWVLLGASVGSLLGQVNQQLALYRFGADAAGQWAYYLSFQTVVYIIVGPIIGYLFPLLNELYKKQEHEKITYLYRILFRGTLGFGIISAIVAYYLAEPVSVLLYGEAFRQAGTLFRYFAPFIFTIPLMGILLQDIASRGMVKQRVVATLLSLCINVLISWWLGRTLGLTSMIYGQVAGNLTLILMGWWRWKGKKR